MHTHTHIDTQVYFPNMREYLCLSLESDFRLIGVCVWGGCFTVLNFYSEGHSQRFGQGHQKMSNNADTQTLKNLPFIFVEKERNLK